MWGFWVGPWLWECDVIGASKAKKYIGQLYVHAGLSKRKLGRNTPELQKEEILGFCH